MDLSKKTLRVMSHKNFFKALLALLVLQCTGLQILAQKVPVTEKTLANGMRLLMVERHDEPSIAGGWVAHVGSSNERPGSDGLRQPPRPTESCISYRSRDCATGASSIRRSGADWFG